MRAETSICLHDCLGFIALGELLLSAALPRKRIIFASESDRLSEETTGRYKCDANAAFRFDQSHLSTCCWKVVAIREGPLQIIHAAPNYDSVNDRDNKSGQNPETGFLTLRKQQVAAG